MNKYKVLVDDLHSFLKCAVYEFKEPAVTSSLFCLVFLDTKDNLMLSCYCQLILGKTSNVLTYEERKINKEDRPTIFDSKSGSKRFLFGCLGTVNLIGCAYC